jgi:Winged helix DNA-binding domain
MPTPVLTSRALGRATLARQLLLQRHDMPVRAAVEHLVGLQAQVPGDPYTALWSRLRDFDPLELSELLQRREAVRTTAMRGTLHLLVSADALAIRPVMQPVLDTIINSNFRRDLGGVNRVEVVAAAREMLDGSALTPTELGTRLHERFPEADPVALRWAAQGWLPMVQVTPRGTWRSSARAASTTHESWLGKSARSPFDVEELVLRYLAAFGPANHRDAAVWSRLPALAEVFERLRPRLMVFANEAGREVFDLPDAPRPDADTPAPVRFLPEYDNVLLGHDERTRIVAPELTQWMMDQRAFVPRGSVLVDGSLAGVWRFDREPRKPHEQVPEQLLRVRMLTPIAASSRREVDSEAQGLVNFLADTPNPRIAISHM